MKKLFLFLFFPLMLSCCKNEKKETIGTIQIFPDSTITIYTSDIFDSYRIVHIEDELCMIVNDFAFFNDKIVVNTIQFGSMPVPGGLASKLKVFDYTGNFLYQIGDIGKGNGEYLSAGKVVTIEEDSTITVNNNTQILNYNINNTLNYSRLLYSNIMGNRLNASIGENCGAINDSCLLMMFPRGEYKKYKFITTSKDGEKVFHGLFDQDSTKSQIFPLLYRYDGKINYYNTDDHFIYEISQDTAIIRYKIVSNKPDEESYVSSIIETKQYVFFGGSVLYDKKSNQSFYYQLIDDMILPKTMNENQREVQYSNAKVNGNFHTHIFFESKYLVPNFVLKKSIDSLRNHMPTNEWASYVTAKPDVMKVFNRIPEKSTNGVSLPILFGYTFKDNI